MRASSSTFLSAALLGCATAASLLTGCGAGSGAGARTGGNGERSTAMGVAVSDDAFAGAVRDLLLSEPGSREREVRLAGVEARQMVRAAERFRAHASERGVAAVTGGLYLVRARELKPGLLGPLANEALSSTVKELANHGDEGRARALYDILLHTVPDAEKRDIQTHIDALGTWTRETVAIGGPVQSADALGRIAVARRLLEPSEAAVAEADLRSAVWVQRALTLRNEAREKRMHPPEEEVKPAVRAFQYGVRTLAEIHLRDADATGAVAAIKKAEIGELAREDDLVPALERVAEKPSGDRWLDVLRVLRQRPGGASAEEDDELEDKELTRAAAWTVAMESYRLDPTAPEAAGAVAAGLQEYGMVEASPAVLVEAMKAHPDPRTIGGALAITMHGMAEEVDAEDNGAARRTYAAAAPILALADDPKIAAQVNPGAGRVRAMMGEIELRDGRVKEARGLLDAAAKSDRSATVAATIARIDRFEGQLPAAVGHLKNALAADDAKKDVAMRGELLLTLSDVQREQNDAAGARASLVDALKGLAAARAQGEPEDRARVERVLARVLDRFGAFAAAHKALERAYDDAPRDKREVSATLGLIASEALVHGDLPTGRDALRRALASDLPDDEIVYLALWVRALEKQVKAKTDGAPEHVFSSILDDGRWAGRLAAFGGGRIKAEELVASAKTPAQKTEALFYAGLDRRAAGDAKGAEAYFKQALSTGGVDLMEVALARDMLEGPRARVAGPVPEVGLP